MLLAGIRQPEEVEPIVARLVAATAQPIEIGDLQLDVAVTIGIALAEDTSTDLQQLLEQPLVYYFPNPIPPKSACLLVFDFLYCNDFSQTDLKASAWLKK